MRFSKKIFDEIMLDILTQGATGNVSIQDLFVRYGDLN